MLYLAVQISNKILSILCLLNKKKKLQLLNLIRERQFKRYMNISPIVSIARDECTSMKVEQLASTLATSAVATALPVMERPGHP
jgi:hypothetical protein